MRDYSYEHMLKTASPWRVMHWYHVGDRAAWNGHLLRCGIDHYAGVDATDPWDPGHGWDRRKQLRLWRVVTPSETPA